MAGQKRKRKGKTKAAVSLGLLMEGNRSYKSIRSLNIRYLNPVELNRPSQTRWWLPARSIIFYETPETRYTSRDDKFTATYPPALRPFSFSPP